MSGINYSDVLDPVYQPHFKENQVVRFTKFVEQKYNTSFDDYWKLHEWSCKSFPEFWECVWEFFGIIYSEPYVEVFDRSRSFYDMEWFRGARLNYTENIFKYRDSHVALILTDDKDNTEYITYQQMYEEVCQYTRALKQLGVKKGDVVACYMSNKKEAVLAFLAVASLGAIWSGALPLLGVQALLARFQQISPKILFTSGNFIMDGKEIKMIEKLKEAVPEISTLEKVIFVPSKYSNVVENYESIPKCCSISEFLETARREYKECPWELQYEQVAFDYPLSICFTSGTTGRPKELYHSTGAYFASLRDYGIHGDITRKDVLFHFTPVGWISWNMSVNTLQLGVTLCLHDGGNPYEEGPSRFWDLVDKFEITSCYIWSSSAEEMEKQGLLPTEKHRITSLKQIFPMGSVTKLHTYDFFQRIKPGIFSVSVYGTTEVYGLISGHNSNLPVYRGEMQAFALGMDVKCFDESGKEVIGERGNLVIANPYPAMAISLVKDENRQKMRDNYNRQYPDILTKYPGYWFVGDEMFLNPVTRGFILYGRCDETLNPQGARFSCSEIYFALENFPNLLDSVCASQYDSERNERVILFVKMKPGHVLTDSVKQKIANTIEKNLTYEHVPQIIMQVPDIPYNLTGKKLNILVKKLINKMPVSNTEFVINPASVEFFKNVDLGEF